MTAGRTAERGERLTLPISGMSCAACQRHVESALAGVPGVERAEVNLLAHRATVTYDPRAVRLEALLEAVRGAGYEASLPGAAVAGTAAEDGDGPAGWRAGVALLAAVAVMGLGMSGVRGSGAVRWGSLVVTAGVMTFLSPQTYVRAWQAARHRATNMNTLVALGTLAAFGYSAAATAFPGAFVRVGIVPDVYFEAVLFILGFLLLGSVLDGRARRRATDALRGFADLEPATVTAVRDGVRVEIPLGEVVVGETIEIRPGDRVPVDAVVVAGRSTVDQAMLTGESVPVVRGPGDELIGGTMNLDGPLTARATTVGAAGTLAQMRRLLEEAQASRAGMQQMADRASAVFVPVVIGLAGLTVLGWLLAGFLSGDLARSVPRALSAAVAVLVIACPCAMGLAVPAAVTVAIGRGAERGILIKGGEVLERLARVDTIALDKTGTLTVGEPEIVGVRFAEDLEVGERAGLLGIAAELERQANHPLARAVVRFVAEQEPLAEVNGLEQVKVVPGLGVTGRHAGRAVAIGSHRLIGGRDGVSEVGGTPLFVAVNGRVRMTLEAKDQVRPTARAAVVRLRELGVAVHLLTGDREAVAREIAEQVGIAPERVHAGMLPAGKVDWIAGEQARGRTVAMVGDGINDAAALARADAGFAMGTGTEMARDAGDAVLLSPSGSLSLTAVPDAIRLGRRAVRTMRQNLVWAGLYNVLGIPLAAGVFYPRFHLLLSPVVASAAMALSSTSVLVNSLRLRRFR